MANRWNAWNPDMANHEFEIFDYSGKAFDMPVYHVHDFYEILVVLQGEITRYTEANRVELHAGDICIYSPGVFHRVVPPESPGNGMDYTRILIYLSPSFMQSLDQPNLSFSSVFDQFSKPADRFLSLPVQETRCLCQPLYDIIRADCDDDPLFHFANRAQIMLFLSHITKNIMQTGSVITKPRNNSFIPQVLDHINTHLDQRLSLDHLAKYFYVSKFYLSHQFKQYTQLSVHQYVLLRRMHLAQQLLRNGHSPYEVSHACGYHEYSSFYKAFTKATGRPPREFSSTGEHPLNARLDSDHHWPRHDTDHK